MESAILERINTLIEEKTALLSRVNQLEIMVEESQASKDAKYLSLKAKLDAANREIQSLARVGTSDEDPANYSKEQLSLMIRNFKQMKAEIHTLKSNSEKYAKEWVKDLDQSSGHYMEVNNLKAKIEELNRQYSELDLKIQRDSDTKYEQQVKQREEIIKSQAEHIQKILWESHKLREYIRQQLDVVVHPVDFKIFRI